MSLEERERSLLDREEQLARLKEELERKEKNLLNRARAVSLLSDREKRQELFASK